jgi:hypothetical protein
MADDVRTVEHKMAIWRENVKFLPILNIKGRLNSFPDLEMNTKSSNQSSGWGTIFF